MVNLVKMVNMVRVVRVAKVIRVILVVRFVRWMYRRFQGQALKREVWGASGVKGKALRVRGGQGGGIDGLKGLRGGPCRRKGAAYIVRRKKLS